MRILQFDSVGGASGDLILGALIDLGVEAAALQADLQALDVGPFTLRAARSSTHHLQGTRVDVDIPGEKPAHHHAHGHDPHRGLREIETIVRGSRLPDRVKAESLRVFGRIAEVEARMHGTTIEEVHFHEIGAVDSIVDVVGCCLARERLEVDGVVVGPLPQGRGTIHCAHGVYPNPAPATVELLKGMAVVQTDEQHELVTPTGAALLATWKTLELPPPGAVVSRAGYGLGHRELATRPNVLRAVLLETEHVPSHGAECLVLECNLDDVSPELVGSLLERLLSAGALDAFTTAAQMKKQRPGALLTVLCNPADRDKLLDLIFRESTTFGVREYAVQRTMLDRRRVEIETPHGTVHVKIGTWRGEDVTVAPEMDDCIRRARERNVPVRTVYESALHAAQQVRRRA